MNKKLLLLLSLFVVSSVQTAAHLRRMALKLGAAAGAAGLSGAGTAGLSYCYAPENHVACVGLTPKERDAVKAVWSGTDDSSVNIADTCNGKPVTAPRYDAETDTLYIPTALAKGNPEKAVKAAQEFGKNYSSDRRRDARTIGTATAAAMAVATPLIRKGRAGWAVIASSVVGTLTMRVQNILSQRDHVSAVKVSVQDCKKEEKHKVACLYAEGENSPGRLLGVTPEPQSKAVAHSLRHTQSE